LQRVMAVGLCRLCLEQKKLIDAHIIPKGFFERIQSDEPTILVNEFDYPRRSRQGNYDQGILCGPCDNFIGRWDQYAQEVLTMDMAGFITVVERGIGEGAELPDYNYALLKLFFISLVWRASIYKRVRRDYSATTHDS
jgi:hypothetical protein